MTAFDDDKPLVTPESTPPTTPDPNELFKDKLSAITNHDGNPKYATVETALDALNHSQVKINEQHRQLEEMKAKMEELTSKVAESQTLDEVVSRITTANETPKPSTETPTSGLNEEAVAGLVQKSLAAEREALQRTANKDMVSKKLVDTFGEKTIEVLDSKAAELGVTRQELGKMSEENPNIVLTLFGSSVTPTGNPTSSSIHIPATTPAREPVKAPEKSVLQGATSKEQKSLMAAIKEEVYADLNVEIPNTR